MTLFLNVYKAFIYSALITSIIYWTTSGTTAFGSLATALFLFAISLLMILILTINNVQQTMGGSVFGTISALFRQSGPLICLLGFIGYVLYLIFRYRPVITSGNVAPAYGTFINLSLALMFVQVMIMLQYQTAQGYIHISGITSYFLYILNVLLFICINIINNTLVYFTTDGFLSGMH